MTIYTLSLEGDLVDLNTNVELTQAVDQATVVKIIPSGAKAITRIIFTGASITGGAGANVIYFELSGQGLKENSPYRFAPIGISTGGSSSAGSPNATATLDFSRNPIPLNPGSGLTVLASMMGTADTTSCSAGITIIMEG